MNTTKLFRDIESPEIEELKKESGKDIAIFGSGTVVQALTNLNLIDEYRLMVNPVVLGVGKPLFKNLKEKLNLKLLTIPSPSRSINTTDFRYLVKDLLN